jgi:hypothetical protein
MGTHGPNYDVVRANMILFEQKRRALLCRGVSNVASMIAIKVAPRSTLAVSSRRLAVAAAAIALFRATITDCHWIPYNLSACER